MKLLGIQICKTKLLELDLKLFKMSKEIVIEYNPEINNLVKVSKYLLFNLPLIKYFFLGIGAFTIFPVLLSLNANIEQQKRVFKHLTPMIILVIVWILIILKATTSIKKTL